MTAPGPSFADSKIVRVAEAGGLQLRRQGARIVALCPFHNENTPSMTIQPQQDVFKCFGCGAKGGYVSLAKQLRVDLDQALGRDSKPENTPRPAALPPARRPSPPVPGDILEDLFEGRVGLPTTTDDPQVLAYIQRRRWNVALEHGHLRFATEIAPLMRRLNQETNELDSLGPAWRAGYRIGVLLYGPDGYSANGMTGIQLRRLNDEKPKFHTIGTGTFGSRRRIAGSRTVYLAEGLGDWIELQQLVIRQATASLRGARVPEYPSVAIGFPGTHTVESQLAPCKFDPGTQVVICFDHDEAGERAARLAADMVVARGAMPLRGTPQ